MASSKDNNLIIFLGLLKTFVGIWSNINSCLNNIPSLEINRYWQVVRLICNIINTMNQSLIQIKNQYFFVIGLGQYHWPLQNLTESRLLNNFHVLKWLKSLNKMHFMNVRGLCLTTIFSFMILDRILLVLSLVILIEITCWIILLILLIDLNFFIWLLDTWSLQSHLLIIYSGWVLRCLWWHIWRFDWRDSKKLFKNNWIYLLLWIALFLVSFIMIITFYFFTIKLIVL